MPGVLDDLIGRLAVLPEQDRKLADALIAGTSSLKWIPSPGPQTEAYFSKADLLLYGGAAGGGKSALLCGLAINEHKRSLLMRRRYTDLQGGGGLIDELLKYYGSRDGFNGSPPATLRTSDGRIITFGASSNPGDEQGFQGRARDLLGVDEAAQFLESQIDFLRGWIRHEDPNQRTRTVLASNPPLSAEGEWLIKLFRPWLDVTHHNPAQSGELRWYVRAPDGTDIEVDGPTPVEFEGKAYQPESRTFIPAKTDDNPYYAGSDYAKQLDRLPEPLRSAMRDGNFMLSRQDDDYQVIKTDHIRQAMARWDAKPPQGVGMSCLAIDPALGGKDSSTFARRHGHWFDELVSVPGAETTDGIETAAKALTLMRDGCPVVVDVIGIGSSCYSHLKNNVQGLTVHGFNSANASMKRTRDGKLKFVNKRAEAWWRFREALEPNLGEPIALPPDQELLADLTTPRWKLTGSGIQIESKDDIRKRLGRSPDKGDAVVMAWSEGESAVEARIRVYNNPKGRPVVNLGHASAKRRR